jgi:hypothetical protein
MHHLRAVAVAAVATCVLLLAGTGVASAAPAKFARKVAVTGTHGFKGTYTINRFVSRHGKLYAVGTLRGKLRHHKVVRRNVRMPASLANAGNSGATTAQVPVPTPGACPILNLTLGPLNLDLLGLRVATNDIHVLIEAIPSPLPGSGLLGNLLCSVNNLLNPGSGTPTGILARLLNGLLGFLGG